MPASWKTPAPAVLLSLTVMALPMLLVIAPLVAADPTAPKQESLGENILPNSDFELGALEIGAPPDKWSFVIESGSKVNGGLTTSFQRSGGRAVVFHPPTQVSDKWQALTYNTDVSAGSTYEFSVWAHYDPSDPLMGDSSGKISIEWKNVDGNEIERVTSEAWTGKKLGQSNGWTEFKIRAVAPAETTRASFVITYYRGTKRGSGGSFIIDDATVRKVEVSK